MMAVLDCLFNSVSGILRKNVDKKSLCDNMEVVMLAMDEMIDNGMIMESDPQQVLTTWCKIKCTKNLLWDTLYLFIDRIMTNDRIIRTN